MLQTCVYLGLEGISSIFTTVSSVQFSRSVVSDSLRPHESQHARPPYPSPSPGVHSNSHPSSRREFLIQNITGKYKKNNTVKLTKLIIYSLSSYYSILFVML